MPSILPLALVLYKTHPALVRQSGEKLEIELPGGETLKVRPKDVLLLHPGPLRSLAELQYPPPGDLQTAWELLAGGPPVPLSGLADLAFGALTPAALWAAWQAVQVGQLFQGDPQAVTALDPAEVARRQALRQAKAAEEQAWEQFVDRLGRGQLDPADRHYLRDVEDLALGRRLDSRTLHLLGQSERPESAHALLLQTGLWDLTYDPYPARLGVPTDFPQVDLPALPDEARLDLTHLPAFAIDDEGNQEPDDAISLEGERRLWVHIADVAALVPPGSPADAGARARGANLYLPEGTIPILPAAAVERLGLGLQPVSPALSFGLDLSPDGQVENVVITPTWVRVQRLTYAEAQERLDQEPFCRLLPLVKAHEALRRQNGAVLIDLPEVRLKVVAGQVSIYPVLPTGSRGLVEECMLMAGEASARYAVQQGLPFLYAVQDPPADLDLSSLPPGLAGSYALRRKQNRSRLSAGPAPHTGLGLPAYSRVTSPLRRYPDLAAHQQLRLHLSGGLVLPEPLLLERAGEADAATSLVNQAELLAEKHWTLVYLLQHPEWQGEGVLVEKRGARGRLIVPSLALESSLDLRGDPPLNTAYRLSVRQVRLPELEVSFRVE